jgi:hypothetical protein
LVALEREDVVGLLFEDFLSDIALTAHGIEWRRSRWTSPPL